MTSRRLVEGNRAVSGILLLGACLAFLLAGCGADQPYGLIPVSGTVTYEDGSLVPAAQIVVTFVPQAEPVDAKTYPRPGMAQVNLADGTFANVTTYEFADGAIVGENKVTIKAVDKDENPTGGVPPEYTDVATTPLEVTVSRDNKVFDFKIPKPK